ncbi:MAG: response regulator [Anaerolineaceae bacterium]|nr:response regulator [Anaerolineaceae bacterium]
MSVKKVLIIDDSYDITRVLRSAVYTLDPQIEVLVTPSAEEAMLEISKGDLDLIVSDIRLPGISGLELLRKIRNRHPLVKIVMMSGMTDRDIEDKAREAGANIFLRKPIEMGIFLDTVSLILGLKTVAVKTNETLIPEFEMLDEEDQEKNLADSLTNLRKEVSASNVWLLSEYGRLVAQSGEGIAPDFEDRWAPLIMPIMSAADTFSQHVEGKSPERAVFSFGIKDYNLFMAPIVDYALVLRVPAGRGSQRMPLVIDTMLEYQQEIMRLLSRMGVLPIDQNLIVVDEDDGLNLVHEFLKEDGDDEVFKALLETKTELPAVDKFWDEADLSTAYDLNNPEILSFDQAAKLGLAPEESEEKKHKRRS